MTAANPVGTHPLWHLLVVAGGAVATFLGIKAREYWTRRARHPRRSRPVLEASREAVVVLAALSMGAAAVHASVCAPHFRESLAFGVFFVAAATLQAAWALIILWRPSRRLLVAATVGSIGILGVWLITRTVGLPFGPEPWHPETIGVADVLTTVAEAALAVGALRLLTSKHATQDSRHVPNAAVPTR